MKASTAATVMEPELLKKAADWTPEKRLEVAAKLDRWVRWLRAPFVRELTADDYAGHWVDANIWFKVGLNKSEAAALKAASKRLLKAKGRTSAVAAHWLLRAALAHFNELHEMLGNDLNYANAEGLHHERYLESLAARAQGIERKRACDGRSIHSCRIEVEVAGQWQPYAQACATCGAEVMKEAVEWLMARKAVSVLRRVRAQFPALGCRVHNDGVDHYWENEALREGRQP